MKTAYWLKGIYEKASEDGINVMLNGQRGNWTISWGHALDYQALLFKQLKWISLVHEIRCYSQIIGVKQSRVYKFVGKKTFPRLNSMLSGKRDTFRDLLTQTLLKK